MNRKLPSDAFEAYVAMGEGRTYRAIAEKFGVSKRCVTGRASEEGWGERLEKIEQGARAISDKRLTETIAEMRERHSLMVRAMGQRVVSALRDYPITDGMDAIRAGEMVIKLERLLAGEATERGELSIEELHRHEIRTLLEVSPQGAGSQVRSGIAAIAVQAHARSTG